MSWFDIKVRICLDYSKTLESPYFLRFQSIKPRFVTKSIWNRTA